MSPGERRKHLLGVAIEVFAAKGIDGANHGNVARAAGVSVPTVHSYFKTRKDLVSAVLTLVRRYIIDETILPFVDAPTFDKRMYESGQNLINTVPANSDYFKIWVMWNAYTGDPFREHYRKFEHEAIGCLCQLVTGDRKVEQNPDLRETSLVLLGLSVFLIQMILRGESVEKQESYIRNVVQMARIWI